MLFFKKNKHYITAFSLSFFTALVTVLLFTFLNGTFYIGSDYVYQQIPFWSHANDAIKSGSVYWNDFLDLGTQFIGGYSFYTIGSPFFWLTLLFPGKYFYLYSGIILSLKIGVAGFSSYLWLRRSVTSHNAALIGSLLYAFSGFQISNLNFNHFADFVALFPFVLYALDEAVQNNRKFIFAISIAVTATCSWFAFVGQVVFLILYFAVRVWNKDYLITKKLILRLAVESILGVGVSMFLLLPSVFFNLANPRASRPFESVLQMLLIKPIHITELIRGMLFPAECGLYRGYFFRSNFNAGELYLPLFGTVLAANWFFNHRRSFETRMILVSLLFMLIPILNSSFLAFNSEYYARWFYMPVLILVLASAKTLEDKKLSLKKGYLFYGVLWILWFLIYLWFTFYFEVTFVYNWVPVLAYSFISLAGFAIVLFLRKIQSHKRGGVILLAFTILFSFVTTAYNIYLMQKQWDPIGPQDQFSAPSTIRLPDSEQYYRIDNESEQYHNLGLVIRKPSIHTFSSTVNGTIFEFYQSVQEPRSVVSRLPDDRFGYRAFLSTQYWIRFGEETKDATLALPGWQEYATQGNFEVYENEYYIPFGYTFTQYLTQEEFQAIPAEHRHLALVHALVLSPEQATLYDGILTHADMADVLAIDLAAFEQDVASRKAQSSSSSTRTNDGYVTTINLEQDNLVFFSIPWDEGWSAVVNGQDVSIEKVDNGFMAVPCKAGTSEIQLIYRPVGGKTGLLITIFSLLLLTGWIVTEKIRKRKQNM